MTATDGSVPSVLALLGGGGHAATVAWTAKDLGWHVAGHYAPEPSDHEVLGPHLGGDEQWMSGQAVPPRLALGIGDCDLRLRLAFRISSTNLRLETIISPASHVHESVHLEPGTMVMAGAIVQGGAKLGRAVIVNSGAVVEHDVDIGAGSHVGPGAVVCGSARIGTCSLVGAGSVVLPRIMIGNAVTVGSGAVVTRDLADLVTAVGSPARPLEVSQ